MTKRNILLGLFILSTAASAGYLIYRGDVGNPLPEGTTLIEGEQHVSEESEYFSVDARYPKVTPLRRELGAEMDAEAVSSFDAFVRETIDDFRENNSIASLTPELVASLGLGSERKFTLIIDYEVYESVHFVSYVFGIYEDSLGAHPNGYYRTFVFDRATARQVGLEDIFIEGSRPLERLSESAYAQVIAQLAVKQGEEVGEDQADYVRIGTSPTPETLQFFAIDGDQFWIIIPPYQAAAYAAGVFDVKVPLSELRDILRPEYR